MPKLVRTSCPRLGEHPCGDYFPPSQNGDRQPVLSDRRNIVVIGEAPGLTDDEVAFYDALETNDSAVKVLGDEALRAIARLIKDTD